VALSVPTPPSLPPNPTHPLRGLQGEAFPKTVFPSLKLPGFRCRLENQASRNRGAFFIMDVLNNLSAEQRTLIVSLPYRAGLWVSHSDEEGGDEAQQKELTALANLIDGFVQQVFGSELLQYIMSETLKRKDEWESWSANLDQLPAECVEALSILREHVGEKDVTVYAMRLMEIGEAVAVAFREHADPTPGQYVSYALSRIKARLQKVPVKSLDQYLSISAQERKALGALASALGIQYNL